MKKRVQSHRLNRLVFVFVALFLAAGYVITNGMSADVTGYVSSDEPCELVSNRFSHVSYCQGKMLDEGEQCAWIASTGSCQYVHEKQMCAGTHRGFCAKPTDVCRYIGQSHTCIRG